MKLTIKTQKLQSMVSRAAKGASENKLLPITSMIAIQHKEDVLTLITTDTANILKVIADKIEGEEFYAVVPVDVFSKLVAKTTSENITLTLHEDSLEFKGNGTYKIALPMDEEGAVTFPDFEFDKPESGAIINLTTIKSVLNINKAAVAKNVDTPCLCGYYVGERVITTDENVICINDINIFDDTVLISPEMMELLALNTQEKINYYRNGDYMLFETSDVVIYGPTHDGIELFPAEDIVAYLDATFPSKCKLPKMSLQNVIDRLSLFIEPYDKNGAYFTFTKQGLKISSKQSSSVETLTYGQSTDFAPFLCCVDIPMLKAQIDAVPGDDVELWYGHDSAIKITAGKVTQVISLLEDDTLKNGNSGS